MATLYTQQSKNVRKTWLLMSLFLVIVIGLGFVLSQMYNNPNILYFFVIFSVVMNIIGYWYSDKIALSMAGAHLATREQYFDLYTTVENLAITAGLPLPKIYVINDPAPNAFATGRNPQKSVICVTTGLLQKLNRNELEAVLGHEMSHIKNYDTRLMVITVVLVGVIVLLSDWIIRSMWYGRPGNRDMGKAGIAILAIGIVFAILSPFIAQIIKMAISRKREFLADADSALLTKNPPALASALEKISSDKEPLEAANKATAHLYIINPLKNYKGWLDNLFSTHPPIKERIAALRGM